MGEGNKGNGRRNGGKGGRNGGKGDDEDRGRGKASGRKGSGGNRTHDQGKGFNTGFGGGKAGGKGQGKGKFVRPVQEGRKIQLCRDMEKFRDSDETELAFPMGLDNHERATLHQHAKKLGLFTKSSGKNETRQLSVWRLPKNLAQVQSSHTIDLGPESVAAVAEYLESFPAEDGEEEDLQGAAAEGASNRPQQRDHKANNKPKQQWPPANSNQWANKCRNQLQGRMQLPSWNAKDELLHAVLNNQVVLVSGETGCGKTTQVPQFILDCLHESRAPLCNIVCTQPRRIAAISVAERVAVERGERCGNTVGYQVRLESKICRDTALIFCTTGIVLRRLSSDPMLRGVTHLIIDEVHERDQHTDFALIILKQLLPRRPDLRVILMSATLDAPLFVDYFGGCPVVHIPGFTYPVQEFYLEEALEHSQYMQCLPAHKQPKGGETDGASLADAYLQSTDQDHVDVYLLVAMVNYILQSSQTGAILVFLPGWEEINRAREMLMKNNRIDVMVLHSMISAAEQSRVFKQPRPHTRKVVLSTNIAETSITINDVIYVVNSGRIKLKSFDPHTGMSTLQTEWVSQSSERQRRGRAGRVQSGVCYHLYSKTRSAALLPNQLAEILRTPLEEICLQVKLLDTGGHSVQEFLSMAIAAPATRAVQGALDLLTALGALDTNQNLTKLGRLLADLPVHPKIGKMLLLAILFDCFDPVLVAACCLAYREPFVVPVDTRARAAAAEAREAFAGGALSDHLALIRAFDGWDAAFQSGGRRTAQDYCRKHSLNHNTLDMVSGMRNQITRELFEANVLKDKQVPHMGRNDGSVPLVAAVLCAGLHPNLAAVKSTTDTMKLHSFNQSAINVHQGSINSGTKREVAAPYLFSFCEMTRGDATVNIRDCTAIPPSVMLMLCSRLSDDVQGDEKAAKAQAARAAAAAAEGEEVAADPDAGMRRQLLDGWLPMLLPEELLLGFKVLRTRLDKVFLQQLSNRGDTLSAEERATVGAITRVVWDEMQQMPGMSTPLREFSSWGDNEAVGPTMQLWSRPKASSKQNKHPKKQAAIQDTLDAFEGVINETVSSFEAFDLNDDVFAGGAFELEAVEMPEFEFGEEFEFQ